MVKIMKNKILILFLGILFLCLNNSKSSAIPAFARKYQTSCVTCHTIYPQLNPFGEAFRINGYQFPADDEEQVKEKQLQLGAEAYKRVWPESVWPNTIPGFPPISLRAYTAYKIETIDSSTTSEFTLPALQLIGACTIGEDISLWVGCHLFDKGEPGSIDNFFLKFDNLFTGFLPEKLLYVRFGQFIPELVPFATHHRGITESAYALNTYDPSLGTKFRAGHVHGAGPFGIEGFQLGVEASGIVNSRLRYVVGLLNGNGAAEDNNSGKDFYGRLAYKFGGMGFDGAIKDSVLNIDSLNSNDETSFAIGAFGYKGVGTTEELIDYDFYRAGADLNLHLGNLNIIGGYITGSNGTEAFQKYNLFFGEADYMFYPWLLGLVRYEQAHTETLPVIKQFVVHFSSLIVANLKTLIETRINPDDFSLFNIYLGVDFAF